MTANLRRRIVLVSVTVLGLAVGVYFTQSKTTSDSAEVTQEGTTRASEASRGAHEQRLLRYSLETNVVRSYAVSQDMTVELSPAQGQSSVSHIRVFGQMDEHLAAVQGQQLTYVFKFSQMRFESNDAGGKAAMPPSDVDAIVQALNTGVLLMNTDVQRSYVQWRADKLMRLETLNLLRSFILAGSVFLPAGKDVSEWNGTEEDSTGVFTLVYRLISLVDGKAVLDKEPRMLRASTDVTQSTSDAQTSIVLPSSRTRIEFDAAAGHLLKAEQRWSLRGQAAGLVATTQLTTHVNFQSKRGTSSQDTLSVSSGIDASQQQFVSEFELLAMHTKSLKTKVAAQKLAGENWQSLRARFVSADFHDDGAARAQFFEQLSALLFLQPELCTVVADEIASLDKKDPDYKSKLALLSGVFSSQETREAEAAMVSLVERLKDDSVALMQVVPALAAHRNPSERTRDALLQLYESAVDANVTSTVTLALGTFASRAKNARPELSREAVDRLKQDFDATPSTEKKVTLVGALGNAGARETLESVIGLYQASQDDSLKRSALYDLRFVDDPKVDSFLQAVVGDASTAPDVAIQGVRVMRIRPPLKMHLQTIVALFRSKQSRPTLRSEALHTIAYLSPVAPEEVRTVLEEAQRDSNAQIAKQAEQLLAKQSQSF